MKSGQDRDLRIYLLTMHCRRLGITNLPMIKQEARKQFASISNNTLNSYAKEVKARLDFDLALERKASSLITEWKSAKELMPK